MNVVRTSRPPTLAELTPRSCLRPPPPDPPGHPKPLQTSHLPVPPPSSRATRSLPYLLAPHSPVRAARSRVPTSPSGRTVQTVQNGSVGAPRPPTRADRTTPQRMTGTRASFRAPMRAHRANRSPSSGTTDPLPTPPKRNGLCDLLWARMVLKLTVLTRCVVARPLSKDQPCGAQSTRAADPTTTTLPLPSWYVRSEAHVCEQPAHHLQRNRAVHIGVDAVHDRVEAGVLRQRVRQRYKVQRRDRLGQLAIVQGQLEAGSVATCSLHGTEPQVHECARDCRRGIRGKVASPRTRPRYYRVRERVWQVRMCLQHSQCHAVSGQWALIAMGIWAEREPWWWKSSHVSASPRHVKSSDARYGGMRSW
jgi:hypothetical protein